jgi:hypothetical protein
VTPGSICVRVTDEHIARGARRDPGSCPVSLALREMAATTVDVQYGITTVGRAAYRTPVSVRGFIADFDSGFPVSPFEFVLDSDALMFRWGGWTA